MYNYDRDSYTCDICGVEGDWGGGDERRGNFWECELCYSHFCTMCFIEKHGSIEFLKMMNDSDLVLCPSCWATHRSEYVD